MKLRLIMVVLTCFFSSAVIIADETAEKAYIAAVDAVTARQGYMQLQEQQMDKLSGAGRGKEAITEATILRAQNLYNLTLMLPDQFPEGTSNDDIERSNAHVRLWEMGEIRIGFINRLSRQTKRLLDMAVAGDEFGFKDEFKQVRATCNKCHKTFRFEND